MDGLLTDRRTRSPIVYTFTSTLPKNVVFSDVVLPDGTIMRRVDESVHRKALANVNLRYSETLNAG